MEENVIIYLIFMILPMAEGAIPGTFFWRPRLGLDLTIPTTEKSRSIYLPNKYNIREGLVVMIDGYQVGVAIISLTAGLTSAQTNPHLNPLSAYFYTSAYRWGLRYFSLLPLWLSGNGGNYCDTHKVWRRRFYYMDEFMPKWARHLFPYVKTEEWEKEEKDLKDFKKYSEPAFGKHYRYPSKSFRDFRSEFTEETYEPLDLDSSQSDKLDETNTGKKRN